MMQNDFGNALLRGEDPIDLDALTRRVLRATAAACGRWASCA